MVWVKTGRFISTVKSEKYALNSTVNVIEEVTRECNMLNGRGKGGKDNTIW